MPPQKSLSQPSEWPTLAGFRFLLALYVLGGHAGWLFSAMPKSIESLMLGGPSPAVLGFFVVSGYSIAASVGRHADYYKRRAIRILPVYYMCLAVAVAAVFTWPEHGGLPKRMLLVNMLLLQGVFSVPAYYGFGQSWSLVCEVAYYLVAPLLNRLKTAGALTVTALSVITYFCMLARPCNFPLMQAGEAAVCLAWAWLIGFLYYKNRTHRWGQWLLAAGYTLIAVCGMFASLRLIGSGNLLAGYRLLGQFNVWLNCLLIVVTPAVFFAASRLRQAPTVSVILNYLGDISYPLYLVHIPILTTLSLNHATTHVWIASAVAIFAAVIINAIDQPTQRRRKLSYSPALTLSPAPSTPLTSTPESVPVD